MILFCFGIHLFWHSWEGQRGEGEREGRRKEGGSEGGRKYELIDLANSLSDSGSEDLSNSIHYWVIQTSLLPLDFFRKESG